jgi:excisionase family DNA binding protein
LNKQPIQTIPSVSEVGISTTQWLTANEAAAYLRIAPRTLLAWARQGRVKGHVLSGIERQTWRFRQADLDACLKEF